MNQKENEATSIMMHFFLTGLTLNFEVTPIALEIFFIPDDSFFMSEKGTFPKLF